MTQELLSEIHQKRPFKSLEQEAYLNVIRTASVLADSFEQILKPAGITSAQYNVLRILQGAEPDGLCRNDVRDRMLTRMPDMTRLLDRMETADLVTRARDSEDRRIVTTRISTKGAGLLQKLDEAVSQEHQRRLGHLSRTELKTLIELLGAVRRGA